jgi:hypothetical protein
VTEDVADRFVCHAAFQCCDVSPTKTATLSETAYKNLLVSRYCVAILRKYGVPLLYWPDVQGFGLPAP